MYKHTLEILLALISGDEHGLNMLEWPFSTGGRQYKQAFGTWVKGDCLSLIEVTITKSVWEKRILWLTT